MRTQLFRSAVCSAIALSACAVAAEASLFVSTGQSGAQVQCDVNHTQHWTYSVSEDISDIAGALLTMKRGPQTSASITFSIYEGDYSIFGSAVNLLSVTLMPADFTQSWSPILFDSTPIALLAGRTYTAVLFSAAADNQNQAYFIKGGSETPLAFVDENGVPTTGGGQIQPPTPAPGAIALLALAGLAGRRRR